MSMRSKYTKPVLNSLPITSCRQQAHTDLVKIVILRTRNYDVNEDVGTVVQHWQGTTPQDRSVEIHIQNKISEEITTFSPSLRSDQISQRATSLSLYPGREVTGRDAVASLVNFHRCLGIHAPEHRKVEAIDQVVDDYNTERRVQRSQSCISYKCATSTHYCMS